MSYLAPESRLDLDSGFYLPPELANLPEIGRLVLGMVWQLPWFNDAGQMLETVHRFASSRLPVRYCYLCQSGSQNEAAPRVVRYPEESVLPLHLTTPDSDLAEWSRSENATTLDFTAAT